MKKTVLLMTLGKGKDGNGRSGGYESVKYRFEDNDLSEETPFFGIALYKHLQRTRKIDKIIVLGTTGSSWDAWWEADEKLRNDDKYCQLFDRVKQGERDEVLLGEISNALSEVFGCTFVCKYIPEDAKEDSCREIMSLIDSELDKSDELHIDVTHGFRFLPMIELMSTFFLKSKGVGIGGIYYGALEKKDTLTNNVPVADLSSLAGMQEWIEAMALFRTTGNPTLLAKIDSMKDFKIHLEQYYFNIQMNNIRNACRFANNIKGLVVDGKLPPEGELFRNELLDQFEWAANDHYADQQYRQFKSALENGDMLKAVLLLFEMTITAYVDKSKNVMDNDAREEAREKLKGIYDEDWTLLRLLRNSVVHDGNKYEKNKRNKHIIERLERAQKSQDKFIDEIKKIEKKVRNLIKDTEQSGK